MKQLPLVLLLSLLLFSRCREKQQLKTSIDWTTYRKAYDLLVKQNDSAFYYFNQVAVLSRDSLQIAMAYSSMANIQYKAGDFYGSQESVLSSLKVLDESNKGHYYYLAGDYNNLGLVRADLNDNDGAIRYYKRNLEFASDSTLISLTWNNIAYAYQQKKDYKQAIAIYSKLVSGKRRDTTEYARALTNLATAKWLSDPAYHPVPAILRALKIRQQTGDLWGQNSSYAHLADYYKNVKPDSARTYAKSMYKVSLEIESPDDQLQALRKLVELSDGAEAKDYFKIYNKLNDSLQTARNAAKNQFALIRYNVEKATADNLKLQKDNAVKKYQLIRQSILFYGTLLIFLLTAAFAVWWYRKRKAQQEIDKQNAIAETNQKASKKVHDTLANDIYRIMKRVQHDDVIDKPWLEENIDEVYQRARDLSYEINTDPDEFFAEKIDELLTGFENDKLEIIVIGNDKDFWQTLPVTYRVELKLVLQEFMVNMEKHSQASNVVVRFRHAGTHYFITYKDDGVGLPKNHTQNNGLKNTGNRIKGINGEITFVSTQTDGLEIQITLPIA